ncbi:MAG TPA: DMT family transporter [Gammaproteobacteria bacterium]|nr:DMT family transporter [Gammaproteobacteria bacterium]
MNNSILARKEYINFILFLILALVWSGSFINIKVVVDLFPPVFCAMVRVFISLLCLSLLFAMRGKLSFSLPKKCWQLWLAGLLAQSLPFFFLFIGEQYIAPAFASIINSTVSIWALILGTLIFRDLSQWTPVKVAGVFLGFAGIILIFSPLLHGSENSLFGFYSVMAMAISYALGALMNQHVIFKKVRVSFETNLIQQHLASVLFLLVSSLSFETWPSWAAFFNGQALLSFLYLGLLATALAYIFYFYLIREWGAVRAASVMYLVPVLAIVWDLLFLQIVPTHQELLGMAAILTGVTLIQWVRAPKKAVLIKAEAETSS